MSLDETLRGGRDPREIKSSVRRKFTVGSFPARQNLTPTISNQPLMWEWDAQRGGRIDGKPIDQLTMTDLEFIRAQMNNSMKDTAHVIEVKIDGGRLLIEYETGGTTSELERERDRQVAALWQSFNEQAAESDRQLKLLAKQPKISFVAKAVPNDIPAEDRKRLISLDLDETL